MPRVRPSMSASSSRSRARKLSTRAGNLIMAVLRWLSSDLCIINYFFIAHGRGSMLYLCRSRINVPRDRRLGKSSHLNVAVSSPRPKARARFRYFEPEEKYFAVTHQLGEQSLKER